MRPQSQSKINIRQTIIGGPDIMICIPLVAKDETQLLQQAAQLKSLKPDLLEWRIDYYGDVGSIPSSLHALDALHRIIDPIPLIFTCRISLEGGYKTISQEDRLNLINAAIRSGHVDIVDLELCNEPAFIDSIKSGSKTNDVKLMLSFHDFQGTPEETFLVDKLKQAQHLGANIAKIAVMPNGYEDVQTLLSATLRARTQSLKIPIVTMAMGAIGRVTRIAGGLFGSDITFAMGEKESAPGQMQIERLRKAIKAVYIA